MSNVNTLKAVLEAVEYCIKHVPDEYSLRAVCWILSKVETSLEITSSDKHDYSRLLETISQIGTILRNSEFNPSDIESVLDMLHYLQIEINRELIYRRLFDN